MPTRSVQIRGDFLASLCAQKHWSQKRLAEAMGISISRAQQITRPGLHKIFSDRFVRLADYLNVSAESLDSWIGADGLAAIVFGDDTAKAEESAVALEFEKFFGEKSDAEKKLAATAVLLLERANMAHRVQLLEICKRWAAMEGKPQKSPRIAARAAGGIRS